ncbi:hypothetical protein ACFC4G_46520 [Streptomyces sp. NPDC056002]|uniref:hypothetical protein n=1 Tax=Streptomyces sp. NPDC056002 TaxID=3345675 RepID=UPI0035D587E6
MEMTEAFATTVAAVAPVILVAAAIDVAVYQRALEPLIRRLAEIVREVGGAVAPTSSEVAARVGEQLASDTRKTLLNWFFGICWGVVMAGQAIATLACVFWLAYPDHPKDWPHAKPIAIVVAVGVATVTVVPLFRLVVVPAAPIVSAAFRAFKAERSRG